MTCKKKIFFSSSSASLDTSRLRFYSGIETASLPTNPVLRSPLQCTADAWGLLAHGSPPAAPASTTGLRYPYKVI